MLCFVLFFALIVTVSAQNVEISGSVIENDNVNTPIYGASIWYEQGETGTVTALNGKFKLRVQQGSVALRISYIGYKTQEISLFVTKDTTLTVVIESDIAALDEIVVWGGGRTSAQSEQTKLSTINVTELPLTSIPKLMGEPDLIRMVQNLPGVKTETDFTGGFFVRGGRNDQNLILLDGVPVYNPWHLFGLFSAFNTEAVAGVELTKGVFPAQYGSRISSVLDISLQEGSQRKGAGYLNVSLFSSSFSYGRPLNQNTSYLLSLRRTYLDPLFAIYNANSTSTDPGGGTTQDKLNYNFGDYSLKVVHAFSSTWKTELQFFRGNDMLKGDYLSEYNSGADSEEIGAQLGWINTTAQLVLRHASNQYSGHARIFGSWYSNRNILEAININTGQRISEDNQYFTRAEGSLERFTQRFFDSGIQYDGRLFFSPATGLSFGAQSLRHDFRDESVARYYLDGIPFFTDEQGMNQEIPGAVVSRQVEFAQGDSLRTLAWENAVYVTGNLRWNRFEIYPGVRYQHYHPGNFGHVLPRINVHFLPNERVTFSAGYGRFAQYIHVLGLDLVRTPTDRWFWSDEGRPPVLAHTFTLGMQHSLGKWGTATVEAYYKSMEGLLAFDPVAQSAAFLETSLTLFSSQTISGTGEAYGMELFWQKSEGALTGWLGYTLSWANNTFDELNFGRAFQQRIDRRHDVQVFLNYAPGKKWDFGLLFNFKSGQPITFATGMFLGESDPLGIGDYLPQEQVVLEMNNFRLPAYHRLDLSVTRKNKRLFRRPVDYTLNIVNVYNRLNVLTVTADATVEVQNNQARITPRNTYIGQLPIIPMFSMRVGLGGDAQ